MIRRSTNASGSQWTAAGAEFEALAARLRELPPDTRARPAADFVRAGDHFLPLSALALSLAALAQMSFDQLRRLPGVGLVKIGNLLALLRRVVEYEVRDARSASPAHDDALATRDFPERIDHPETVTPIQWSSWCDRLRRRGLLGEPLGRFAPRLGELPRNLWEVRLASYAALPLPELRELKGYGPRRFAVIVSVFRDLAALVELESRLAGDIGNWTPGEATSVENWLIAANAGASDISRADVSRHVVEPLVQLLSRDLGRRHAETIRCLAARALRSEIDDAAAARASTKRTVLDELSPSRVQRIRQDAAAALRVRWPRGECAVRAFIRGACRRLGGDERAVVESALSAIVPDLVPGRRWSDEDRREPAAIPG